MASASWDQTIKIWGASGKELQTLRGHTAKVMGVVFSPEGEAVVSAAVDGILRIWNVSTGEALQTVPTGLGSVTVLAFGRDGRHLAVGGYHQGEGRGGPVGRLQVWDMTRQPPVVCWDRTMGTTGWPLALAFDLDGHRLASGSTDRIVRLWDSATGEVMHTLTGHTRNVQGVAFSPDGQRLASCSSDTTIKLWDVARGRELLTLRGHVRDVDAVAFSGDGTRILSADVDGIKIWDGAPLAEMVEER
jgi:WD40 repeat protein